EFERLRPVDPHALRNVVEERLVGHRPERIARRVHHRLPAEVAQVLGELERAERAAATLGGKAVGDQERGLLRLHDELRSYPGPATVAVRAGSVSSSRRTVRSAASLAPSVACTPVTGFHPRSGLARAVP